MKLAILGCLVLATPALADTDGHGHMMGWGYGYGFGMILGPVIWIIVLGLVVAGVIWLVRNLDGEMAQKGSSRALAELDMRLAKGEIDADEYAERKKLLSD